MKCKMSCAALLAALFLPFAAQGAMFNYHGTLQDAGEPAEGSYDLELTLFSAAEGGHVIAGPLLMYQVPVHDGNFSTAADFGPLADTSGRTWLGVRVRNAGNGEFAALSARAPLALDATAVTACPGSWSLNGNAGNTSDLYLGTADSQPLIFKVNGVSAGSITPGKGVAFGQAGFGSSANGLNAFATGNGVFASGAASFAGGFGVTTAQSGTYMWGDSNTGGGIVATTGPNQYIVRAGGGVGINGAPKDSATELTIYPSLLNGSNFSEIFMGGRSQSGGILLSTAPSTTPTGNDATLYVDQYNGTVQERKLQINVDGMNINGFNTLDTVNFPSLSIFPGPRAIAAFPDYLDIDVLPANGQHGYLIEEASAKNVAGTDTSTLEFLFKSSAGTASLLLLSGSPSQGTGLSIMGAAYKPGGGTWSSASDRRVKQDIVPIHDALDTVSRLRPVSFRYTPEYRAAEGGLGDKTYLGFVAQEFADVFPEAVTSTGKRVPGAADGDATILALDSNPALITTVAAVQELAVENSALHRQIDSLEARLKRLEAADGDLRN